MGIWIMMLFFSLLLPGIMLLCGWMFVSAPPKEINDWFGYRTSRSKKSRAAWDFAHGYAGKCWMKWGLWTLVPSVAVMLALLGQSETVTALGGCALMIGQLVPVLAVIPVTEKALRERFDGEGNPIAGKLP